MSETTAPVVAATPPDPIRAKLAEVGLETYTSAIIELGVESVEDLGGLTEADLVKISIPVIKARKLLAAVKPTVTVVDTATTTAMTIDALLPSVPDDSSWLNSLRSGGVLKINQATVISAIRAALANKFGLYDIPKRLLRSMEEFVDVTEEQVGSDFWKLRKLITRRSYGDLFEAIDGLDGNFVTEGRKDELLSRINATLWPSIMGFHTALTSWQDAWAQGAANPGMMFAALAAASGGGGIGLPPGVMQPPDCGVLRDAAETVNDAMNKTFRGTGVQITAALAYEANQIKGMLDNPSLPMMCGVPTKDMLLKQLKVAVPATYPRMEQNLTKFVLGIMDADKIAAGNDELRYFGALYMLGSQIPWSDLGGPGAHYTDQRPAGIGSRAARSRIKSPADLQYDRIALANSDMD